MDQRGLKEILDSLRMCPICPMCPNYRMINMITALGRNSMFQEDMGDSILTDNFDLWVYDSANNIIGQSLSFDNSYEISEFNGEAGKTYKIIIKKNPDITWKWYGIAWTVV
jgi:hypothetical protein